MVSSSQYQRCTGEREEHFMEHSYEGVHEYYLDRIRFAMTHNFQNREELLSMISRVAFVDSF